MSGVRSATRYVAWLGPRARQLIVAHVALVLAALYLAAFHLPLRADFSNLLPQDAPAVRDLRRLEARVKASDTVLVLVKAPTSDERAATADVVAASIRELPASLVELVITNHDDLRRYLETNGYLLASLEQLQRARDALAARMDEAKLEANPLFIRLDDEEPHARTSDHGSLDELVAQQRDARAKLARLSNVSADGTIGLVEVRTAFRSTDAGSGAALLGHLAAIRAGVHAAHSGVEIGFTGSVVTAVAEHRAIAGGVLHSCLLTGVLVILVLAFYFRSAVLLTLVLATLVGATVMAFGLAALTVGHLNAATAFLGAIIAGNGINFGILLVARYVEERRAHSVEDALAHAISATLRPTAIAALGAAIAYGSLAATSFKGFADFAVIGSAGMVLVWMVTYALLPPLLLRFGRGALPRGNDPWVGRALARCLGPRRPRVVGAVMAVASVAAAIVVARYVADDPFEYNLKRLRSEGADALEARRWMALSNRTFGSGVAGRTVIAADRPDQVPMIVDALRSLDAKLPPDRRRIGDVWSLSAFLPADQPRKLAYLGELRALVDQVVDEVPDDERSKLRELRPPDGLQPITMATLPASLRDRFTERDGRVGNLIEIRPAPGLDEWNGRSLINFARAVREVRLRDGERVTTSGTSVIFADIVSSIERDGPVVTLIAAASLVVMVLGLAGGRRRALAVLASTGAGALFMVAGCALLELRVNFLDFIALPITLGIGVDYAINIAHRFGTPDADTRHILETSGGAVLVCSLTTIIGYGSLLVSDNLAIRGFGTASLVGEVACVVTALVLVPAMLRDPRSRFRVRADAA